MENIALIESITDLKNEKFIDSPNLMFILDEVLRAAIRKQFGADSDFNIIMNPDNGDMEIWRNFIIVEDDNIVDSVTEIKLSDAIKVEPDFEVGEELSMEIKLKELDRRTILSLRQNLKGKLIDFTNSELKEQFTDLIGELYSGEVNLIRRDMVILLDDNGNELFLPKTNQISGDFFRKGDTVRGVIDSVETKNNKTQIILSRTSDVFLEKLFESEIPEIMDGVITVRKVARLPGQKSKVAVESYDDRLDAVGVCVGVKGSRINSIVRELNNEFIDVINWTDNERLLLTRSLNPAKIQNIEIEDGVATIEVESIELPKVIGRSGSNIKLASSITGLTINILNISAVEEDDVALIDFSDEIEEWILKEFLKVGLDTAKSVLKLTEQELVRRTDLEDETIEEVIKILKSEFN